MWHGLSSTPGYATDLYIEETNFLHTCKLRKSKSRDTDTYKYILYREQYN